MTNQQRTPEPNGERRIIHVERQGRTKYTYYDDGLVKITRYKSGRKIYWGRIFVALIVFVLLIMAVVQLFKSLLTSAGSRNNIPANTSMPSASTAAYQEESSSGEVSSEESTSDSIPEVDINADYSNVTMTVCLDAGHGDYDTGTVADDGKTESAENLEIALLVREYLEQCGVTVVMTRDSDKSVSLSDRCTAANQANADFFVSLHRNSSSDDLDENGVEIWVNNNEPKYDTALAVNIAAALEAAGVSQNRGVKYGYIGMPDQNYQVNTDTVMPSCLVELGFITNETDNALFEEKKSLYAKAIGNAVIKTAVQLGVIDEDGSRLLNEQLVSADKTNVTENY
jgi:N-acetylmuramoyl-L-alanine amidase